MSADSSADRPRARLYRSTPSGARKEFRIWRAVNRLGAVIIPSLSRMVLESVLPLHLRPPDLDVLMTLRPALTLLSSFVFLVVVTAGGRAAAQTPAAPTLLGPANSASVQVPLTISWSSTLNPSETSGGYNWQVSRSSTFSPLVLADSTSPATTQDVVSGLTPGTYFWRVQAVNGSGQSAWSQARSFTVTGAGPGTPGTPVLAPTRGYSTFHPWEFIHFDWSAVPDAVTYRLEVSNDPNFPLGPVAARAGFTRSGTTTFLRTATATFTP